MLAGRRKLAVDEDVWTSLDCYVVATVAVTDPVDPQVVDKHRSGRGDIALIARVPITKAVDASPVHEDVVAATNITIWARIPITLT